MQIFFVTLKALVLRSSKLFSFFSKELKLKNIIFNNKKKKINLKTFFSVLFDFCKKWDIAVMVENLNNQKGIFQNSSTIQKINFNIVFENISHIYKSLK